MSELEFEFTSCPSFYADEFPWHTSQRLAAGIDDDAEVDGDDNGAHPPHVFQAQCDRVVPVLVFAILVRLPAENKDIADDVLHEQIRPSRSLSRPEDPLVVQVLHQAALVVVQDRQGDLVCPWRTWKQA